MRVTLGQAVATLVKRVSVVVVVINPGPTVVSAINVTVFFALIPTMAFVTAPMIVHMSMIVPRVSILIS